MKPIIKPTWVLMLLAALLSLSAKAQNAKPNIVVILIDDMGYKDAGFTGSDFYETPNINALAKQGMVFNNAYAGAGNCAPSRACLISGQYTPRHGVYAVSSTDRGPKDKMRLIPVPNNRELAPSNFTIAEAMKLNGYVTGMFGKWHLGNKEGVMPHNQGFDVDGNLPTQSNKEFKATNDPKSIYAITNGACKFLEDNRNKPFFLYVAHHATHMMIQARKEMYDRFKDKPAGKYQSNRQYAAMNAQMDDGVGILLKKIKDLGLEKNTLVIFTSDNGGLPQSPQNPLRSFKGTYYEGGIKEPFIARWPGVIKPGTTCDQTIINQDLYPTFVQLAGGKLPADKVLDGQSIVDMFKGKKVANRKPKFWYFPGYLDHLYPGGRDSIFRTRPVTAMRKGDWKILLYHEEWLLDGGMNKIATNNAVEIYNLKNDIGEQHNLANVDTAKRNELIKDVLAWHKQVKAILPVKPNPKYKP